ncbi:hypothetical protein ATANTOWER_005923 [Ataeniobius toweri]|uniref:Uncharacterized protein n=1 Tax=Ataeniobius toweri TaxID=208326 RepID=A0ABU7BNL1_9TELE|nr:hypothetical protein [Ataeniobius toweri]
MVDVIHPRSLATMELFNHLRDFESPTSASTRKGVIEEILEVFLSPPDNVPVKVSSSPLPLAKTGEALLSAPEAPDGLAEPLRGQALVLLHGLIELLPANHSQ